MWMKYSRVSQAFGGRYGKEAEFGVDPESSSYLLLGDTFRCARARKVISGGLSFFWRRTFRVSIQRCQFNEIRHNPLLFCYLLFSAKKATAEELLLSVFLPSSWCFIFSCSLSVKSGNVKMQLFHPRFSSTYARFFFVLPFGSTALASNAANYFYSQVHKSVNERCTLT